MKISLNLDFGRRDKRSDETSTWDRPSAWLINALGGGKAKSGVVVTETTALNLSAVYGATAIISGSIASMPLMLYRRLPDGSRERATRHPLYRALHVRPNARMTPYQWKELISHHVDIWGNSYNYIDRSRPEIEFIPLLPDRTRPVVVDGRLKYTTIIGGQMLDIPPRDMLHIAGLGFDGRRGYGVVSYAKQSLGLALAIEEFGSQFFANDATPGGVIEHPNAFKGADGDAAVKRLRQSWEEQHRSMDNKHKIAILEEGAKYHQLGVPPEQAQFLASRKFNIAEVARWFGLPLSKLKDLDRAIQANMEQQSLEYFQDCLLPRTVRIEQAIEAKLLGEEEREEYYVKFLHAGLLRADVKTRNEAYEIQRRNGVLSTDEWRELEDMNPTGDDGGKVRIVAMNMMALDDLVPDPPEDPGQPSAVADGDQKIQDTAMNGAQVQSLLQILSEVVAGRITKATAKQAILLAFPLMGEADVDKLLADVEEGSDPDAAVRSVVTAGSPRRAVRSVQRRTAEGRRRVTVRYRSRITKLISGLVSDEIAAVRKAMTDELSTRGAAEFGEWLKQFYRDLREEAKARSLPVFASYAELIMPIVQTELGSDQDVTAELDAFVEEYADTFAIRHTSASRGELYATLEQADGEDEDVAIEETLQRWERDRVEDDADTESIQSEGAFTKKLFAVMGVAKIMSISLGDSCPYCSDLDGKVIGIDQVFIAAGESFQPDGAEAPLIPTSSRGHPPYHRGCDCGIVSSR